MKKPNPKATQKTPTLRKGESVHSSGGYQYRWFDSQGKRRTVHAMTLSELREKEEQIVQDKRDGIKPESANVTVNDLFDLWRQVKRGLKDNTFQNYKYMYTQFVSPSLGKKRIGSLVRSDIKRFYNTLAEERGLTIATVDGVIQSFIKSLTWQ